MSTNNLDEGGELMSTGEAADEADVSETTARDWAVENAVQRVGNAFVWTPEDVDDFIADLDEDEEEEDEEEDEDDEDAA